MTITQSFRSWQIAQRRSALPLVQQMASEDRARQSVARDVHDVVSHHLISAHLLLGRARSRRMDGDLRNTVDEVAKEIQLALNDLRSLCFLLNSPFDAEVGLDTEVQELLSGFAERCNLKVCSRLTRVGSVGDLVHQTIVRVLQEALSNIFRHAKATEVGCSLRRRDRSLNLIVHDNGAASKDKFRPGVGVSSMMARVEELGGQFRLRFGTRGTTVAVRIPLPA
ncbi:hypothetical protein GRI89_03355 [Altererythrobacter salegens]|uniref:Histidine kinase/HSP90-like ATPase domain-containing protein n=1 Tax=Croceibacterium salegens TaxID=1737568 RepID=A0A6I4SSQ8_9SPHN|nr:histidine kinase [Croceibacterium salegens]MXO58579.1 hypothetical protein [Croceibacterium salegens]